MTKAATSATASSARLPKMKQTVLGLYVTAKEAYDKWKAAEPDSLFTGQRLKNGWKSSGRPWTYDLTPDRMLLPKPRPEGRR